MIDVDKFRRTLGATISAGFDAAFARVKELVADFRASEKFPLSPAYRRDHQRAYRKAGQFETNELASFLTSSIWPLFL